MRPALPVVGLTLVTFNVIDRVTTLLTGTTNAAPPFGNAPIVMTDPSSNFNVAPVTWSFELGRSYNAIVDTLIGPGHVKVIQAPTF